LDVIFCALGPAVEKQAYQKEPLLVPAHWQVVFY
jgi:hypothetical protein